MKNGILKTVVDGPPGALKTQAFNDIQKRLSAFEELKIVFVEEAARAYFKLYGRNGDVMIQQKGIFQLQLDNELNAIEKAQSLVDQGFKVLMWHDRSLMTSKGYLPAKLWNELINHFEITEVQIASRYDLPIHFVSAAVDVPHLYENDPERNETLEEAVALDFTLGKIWDGYFDNVPRLDNLDGKEAKFQKTWEIISNQIFKNK